MNLAEARDWLLFGIGILVWAFTLGAVWSRLNSKIDQNAEELKQKATKDELNGFGARVKVTETDCSEHSGRMDRFEKELSEYRRDAQSAAQMAARVEKTVDDLRGEIQQGNLAIGSQLHGIERLIQERDKQTSNRLVRIETLQKIEKKIGPIPED